MAAFLAAVVLILLQDYLIFRRRKRRAKEIPGDQVIETIRGSDQLFRRIEEAVSKKGNLTVDELSDIVLSEDSSLEFRGESLRVRLREMDDRIAATLEEMSKRGPPDRK